jgi:cardiolipin synthase
MEMTMNTIADSLTLVRGILVINILYEGIFKGVDSLPQIILLTIACWLTDVLDGMLARKSTRPTRLGELDLVMDLGLALSLAVCLAVWDIVPAVIVIAAILVVVVSELIFHFTALRKLAMGITYAGLLFASWQTRPAWIWVVLGGLAFLLFIAPKRFMEQAVQFLGEVRSRRTREDTHVKENGSHQE